MPRKRKTGTNANPIKAGSAFDKISCVISLEKAARDPIRSYTGLLEHQLVLQLIHYYEYEQTPHIIQRG